MGEQLRDLAAEAELPSLIIAVSLNSSTRALPQEAPSPCGVITLVRSVTRYK